MSSLTPKLRLNRHCPACGRGLTATEVRQSIEKLRTAEQIRSSDPLRAFEELHKLAEGRTIRYRASRLGEARFLKVAEKAPSRGFLRNEAESFTLNGNSLGEIRGAHLQVSDNPAGGVLISAESSLVIFGFQASQTSRLTTNNNQGPGILIGQGHLFVAGSGFAPGAVVITSRGNTGPGVRLVNGNITSPFGAASLVIENNPIGMQFQQGSTATVIGGLNVRSNVLEIDGDNATGLTFVSVPPNPSAIQSNGTDVRLTFGTKSTITGVVVGTIVCDATVLSRGTVVCP